MQVGPGVCDEIKFTSFIHFFHFSLHTSRGSSCGRADTTPQVPGAKPRGYGALSTELLTDHMLNVRCRGLCRRPGKDFPVGSDSRH